ncbi:hypothetical protein JDS87_14880 [Bacillus cereus]|uniref:DUF7018 domain-containing (lipo)protein n=1 Tax=Bacillus cereus TaxID=1396 RepID=UPI0018F44C3D|nr:hypothetical protein [Bacillus cereus]MBJ8053224.1 hypothetical protein [Bacillus cereus]
MKATKLIALTVPVLLLFGCGVGDKDSTPKTQDIFKKKVVLSEKQYPNYICEQMVEFQFVKKDGYLIKMGEFIKEDSKTDVILDSVDEIEETVKAIENIEAPAKYQDQQKVMLKGASELRKGLDLIRESSKKDKDSFKESVARLMENLSVAYLDYWEPTTKELSKYDPDAYGKALDKLMKEHAK